MPIELKTLFQAGLIQVLCLRWLKLLCFSPHLLTEIMRPKLRFYEMIYVTLWQCFTTVNFSTRVHNPGRWKSIQNYPTLLLPPGPCHVCGRQGWAVLCWQGKERGQEEKKWEGAVAEDKIGDGGGREASGRPDARRAPVQKGAPLWHRAWAATACYYSQLIPEHLRRDSDISFWIVSGE